MSNQCPQCEKYQKELEDKEEQLAILKENIFETKRNIIESSNLIKAYVEIKSENEVLKKENESYRVSKENKIDQYQLDIFKQQMINLKQKNVELKLAYDQTASLLTQYQASKETNSLKENKLRRELSEKDRYINSQNLIINRLKNEKKSENAEEANDELSLEKKPSYSNTNTIQLRQLVEENECLTRKYQKYQTKYYKYKYKFEEFKECTMMFLDKKYDERIYYNDGRRDSMMNYTQRKRNRSEDNDYDNMNISNNNNKSNHNRTSFDFENCKVEDIFEGKNDIVEEENISGNNINNNDKAVVKDESNVKKNIKKTKLVLPVQRRSKRLDKDKENNNKEKDDNLEINEEEEKDKNKMIKTIKKEKHKAQNDKDKDKKKTTKTKKQKTKSIDISKENPSEQKNKTNIDKDSSFSQNKQIESNKVIKPTPHINPIKKPKQTINQSEQVKQTDFSSRLIQFLNENKQQSKQDLILLIEHYPTISEKVTSFLEVIHNNISILNISSTLQVINLFISSFDSNIVIANFIEFINTHLQSLSKEKQFLYEKNSQKTDSLFSEELLSLNHTSTHFISYLMRLFFYYNNHSEVTKYFFNLLDSNNNKLSNRFQIIDFYNRLHSENHFPNANLSSPSSVNYINQKELETYKDSNKLSLYFFSNYKSRLITEDLFNYLLFINDSKQNEQSVDSYIISMLQRKLSAINDSLFVLNEANGMLFELNLSEDILYLEIYQMIYIAFNIRDIDWIYDKIFTSLLWQEFSASKDKSLKRALIVYYSSVIYYIGLNKDNSEMKEKTLKIFGWLYSIYSKQFEPEKITIYDQICALAWVVDSSLITLYDNPSKNMKEIISQMVKVYPINFFPKDFVAIIKKNKFLQ